jgi:hypothetical protein
MRQKLEQKLSHLEVHQFLEIGFLKTQWIQTGLKCVPLFCRSPEKTKSCDHGHQYNWSLDA